MFGKTSKKKKPGKGGFFGGVDKARKGRGIWIIPGWYIVKILSIKAIESWDDTPYFIVEVKVLMSSLKSRPKGTVMSWVVDMTKAPALGNVRDFASIITDAPFEQIDEDVCNALVSDDQPCAGTVLELSATQIETKKHTPFTKCSWTLVGTFQEYLKKKKRGLFKAPKASKKEKPIKKKKKKAA